jgi:hypothetical protein
MARRPRIFIGSSTSGLKYAEALNARLDEKCEVTLWSYAFRASRSTLDNLVDQAHSVDFAALVLTPDDLLVKAGEEYPVARDNVLFEAGLFMGTLGPERTFLVCSRDQAVVLPTDLAGITQARWGDRSDENWDAALLVPAREILQAMKRVQEATAKTEDVFDGRHAFDLGEWSLEKWNEADGDVSVHRGNVLRIARGNAAGNVVLWHERGISRGGGGDRVLLKVSGAARASGAHHTLVLVFRETDAPVGQHVWDLRARVTDDQWKSIDGEREITLRGDCRVRIEDRSVSAAPSQLELRELLITARRLEFDLEI